VTEMTSISNGMNPHDAARSDAALERASALAPSAAPAVGGGGEGAVGEFEERTLTRCADCAGKSEQCSECKAAAPAAERRVPIMPLQSSSCTSQGDLRYKPNEDGLVVVDDLQAWLHANDPDFDEQMEQDMSGKYGRVALYAVVDGHNGDSSKTFLCKHLPHAIARELVKADCSLQNVEAVLTRTFAHLDARLVRLGDDGQRICDNGRGGSSGAAAVVALVTAGEIITAHVGDCRAMLCRVQHTPSGEVRGCEALEMTAVHHPIPNAARLLTTILVAASKMLCLCLHLNVYQKCCVCACI
jgi:hypothetical protein